MKFIQAIMPALLRRSLLSTGPLLGLALCLALLAPACGKKAAKTTPPVLVPSIESAPQPEPEPQPAAEPEAPANPAAPDHAPQPELQKPRPKPHKPPVRKPLPPAVVEAPKPEPSKVEPKPEPTQPEASHTTTPDTSSQITAAVPRSAVQSQTQSTEQLLHSSEAKLAGLNRPLDQSEQAMASQARNYIAQSNEALHEGEVERAYNLAVKASLLAAELAK
jgi:outer membrane biosynthesis protein TonB